LKRWLLIAAVVLVSLSGLLTAAVYLLVDAEAIRELVVEQASTALERRVEVGELGIVLFPQPAVRLSGLQVEGDPGAPKLVSAESLSLSIAVLPLFSGSIELDSVALERPVIRLPVDREGLPVVPEFGGAGQASDAPAASGKDPKAGGKAPEAEPEASSGGAIRLAIDQISLTDGSFEAGEWKLSGLDVGGDFDLSGESRFSASADLPGLGELRDIQVELRGLDSEAPVIEAKLRLVGFALAALGKRLALVPDPLGQLVGELSGDVSASLKSGELEALTGDLRVSSAQIAASGARLAGPIPIRFQLGGPFALDLTDAEVSFESSVRKPAGERLQVQGTLGKELGPAILTEVRLGLGPNDVPLRLALDKNRLTVSPCAIDLSPLAGWLDTGGRPLAGKLSVTEPLQVVLDPLRLTGKASLDQVRVPLEKGDAALSGPIVASGKRIRFDPLTATVGEQKAKLIGAYDLEAGRLELDLGIEQADVDALVTAVSGSSQFAGVLGVNLALRGAPAIDQLEGSGGFSIKPGEIRGFSLLRQVLGPLAQVAEQVLRSRGKDLSRYEQEKFELLEGKVQLARGVLRVERLLLQYDYGRAELSGKVELIGDQKLDLVGTVTLPPEVAADVLGTASGTAGGTDTGRPLVLPDVPIRGTLENPRVQVDGRVLAQIVSTFAARKAVGDKLDEKLREKLGSQEEVDAVKGLLEGVLGGRRKREP